MKILVVLVLVTLKFTISDGQSNEISIHANSGFFSFGGPSSTESSFINISDVSSIPSYTDNPYGKSSGPSYGVAIQYQHRAKNNLIFGVQGGYEKLSSRTKLDAAYGEISWSLTEGQTILTHQFINFYPYIGRRFEFTSQIKSDLMAGFDFAWCITSNEHYEFTTSAGKTDEGVTERDKPTLDFRPRISFTTYYKRLGISLGYSLGLADYMWGMDGGENGAYSKYLRLGVVFQLTKSK